MKYTNDKQNEKKNKTKEYFSPKIILLGSAVQLTRGGNSNGSDLYGARVRDARCIGICI
ncbi:hypothetical protein ICM_05953 [Bacillus cereus BAG1X2-3]|uniref:hypothetical protein n=1 Tax=Bacillus cereus group TaxID=86661 RepID=UPI00032F95D5|nr:MULTISPECIES: hypothetical protein [Bacillus cereus group]EOO25059.1 hypothetical protein ICC_04980 [Bacillus cereus BAG1X1-1]EOO44050.1 hypothetical protein ICI_05481 [Bacillus cereus BAG1X2-1]EOO46192.1 hypothetical protein ICK_05534 [Bacillus cereus BAG1X2-2]EOO62639.1 hypothetical protein ICM_05953 [Bacillus cereus BAG1X2-3]EOP01555.1 hypothetical protein ICO_05375 [Bacillus cereus BAG2O-1]